MRIAMILGAAALLTGAAEAQRPGASYPVPGAVLPPPPPLPPRPVAGAPLPPPPLPPAPMRGGRWWGGNNAPGGWAAYRAPYRGYRLPRYWVAPRFTLSDWDRYGFRAPGAGQYWTRYYDDAVLIDARGTVIDTVGGVDWDGHGRYDLPVNDYAGTVRYDEDGPGSWISPDGRTTVTTTTHGGYGFPAPGYGYRYGGGYGGSATTVTVQSAPVVTTTTTVVEEEAVYRRAAVRRVYRKRVHHYRPRRRPACVCGS